MNEPSDKELLEFVARFAGVQGVEETAGFERRVRFPDYLHSVDAWLKDVWPKIRQQKMHAWWWRQMQLMDDLLTCDLCNADARSRCLALYRALDGQLLKKPANSALDVRIGPQNQRIE